MHTQINLQNYLPHSFCIKRFILKFVLWGHVECFLLFYISHKHKWQADRGARCGGDHVLLYKGNRSVMVVSFCYCQPQKQYMYLYFVLCSLFRLQLVVVVEWCGYHSSFCFHKCLFFPHTYLVQWFMQVFTSSNKIQVNCYSRCIIKQIFVWNSQIEDIVMWVKYVRGDIKQQTNKRHRLNGILQKFYLSVFINVCYLLILLYTRWLCTNH